MKIFYIDTSTDGHHQEYASCLIGSNAITTNQVIALTAYYDKYNIKQYIIKLEKKNIIKYLHEMFKLRKIILNEKPDIIHFLNGDIFYKHFGIGLKMFIKYNTIITFHHIRRSKLRDISIKHIFKKIDVGIVHTKSILNDLIKMNINNVNHVEYPYFCDRENLIQEMTKEQFGFKKENPVLLALGGTRYDKGLDILLEALNYVKEPFQLLIAGKEEWFKSEFIKEKIINYNNNTVVVLKYLTNDEVNKCIQVSNIIVLPYRKVFNGASGPLTKGVALQKMIIGPNHGSLRQIINENHLGYTFEAENIQSLANTISLALKSDFIYDNFAIKYRDSLTPDRFYKAYNKIYNSFSK